MYRTDYTYVTHIRSLSKGAGKGNAEESSIIVFCLDKKTDTLL